MATEAGPSRAKVRMNHVQGIGMSVIAVSGFILIIAIAVWGGINALRLAPDFFNSLGKEKAATLTMTVSPARADAGQNVIISWKASKPKDVSTYIFSYQCKDSVSLDGKSGNSTIALPCQTAITVGTTTTIVVAPKSNVAESSIGLAVTSVNADKVRIAEATSTLTVVSMTSTSTPPYPSSGGSSSGTSKPTPKPTPRPVGTPDLSVRILAVGVIDQYSGSFVERAPISDSEITAVQFDVSNIGAGPTGTWYFSATLPVSSGQTSYSSPGQPAMGAGSHTIYTLKFNRAIPGGTFSVSIDSGNAVRELNESNNSASTQIVAIYQQASPQPHYQYPYGY